MLTPVEQTLPRKLFRLRNNDFPFFTGRSKNGNQILIGVQQPEIALLEFTAEGNLISISTKEVEEGQRHATMLEFTAEGSLTSTSIPHVDDDQLSSSVSKWQMEIGFTPGMISVERFFLEERQIGIKDLPAYYQEVVDHPEKVDPEERQQTQEDILLWRASGDFVFYWDEDYYFEQNGEMASS